MADGIREIRCQNIKVGADSECGALNAKVIGRYVELVIRFVGVKIRVPVDSGAWLIVMRETLKAFKDWRKFPGRSDLENLFLEKMDKMDGFANKYPDSIGQGILKCRRCGAETILPSKWFDISND